jgi:hypothetical protein
MTKILNIVGFSQTDYKYEDQLNEVLQEVHSVREQGIFIPDDLEMMLEAKV